ncbi:MAG: hypothetical protein AAFX79_10225 [Planctomycetota bacterium]
MDPAQPTTPPTAPPTVASPARACGSCGYPMRDLPANAPCPECGIAPSVPCISCGYELTGLAPEGACPECGEPVARSLRGDFLAFCGRDYLRTLARGLKMARWGLATMVIIFLVSVVLVVLVGVAGAGFGAGGGGGGPAAALGIGIVAWFLVAGLGGLTALILLLVGLWFASTRDPGKPDHEDPRSRRVLRGMIIAYIVVTGVSWLFAGIGAVNPASATGALFTGLNGLATIAGLIVLVVFLVALSRYLRTLADRVPDKIARRHAKRIVTGLILFAIGIGLAFAGLFVGLVGGGTVVIVATIIGGLLYFLSALFVLAAVYNAFVRLSRATSKIAAGAAA